MWESSRPPYYPIRWRNGCFSVPGAACLIIPELLRALGIDNCTGGGEGSASKIQLRSDFAFSRHVRGLSAAVRLSSVGCFCVTC
jgi:hypothetical protein